MNKLDISVNNKITNESSRKTKDNNKLEVDKIKKIV